MKEKIIGGLLTLIVVGLLVVSSIDAGLLGDPIEVYQVYLNGKKIGLIKDKEELYNLIDTEQVEIKEKYGVDKVYPPDGLDVKKIYTYNNNVSDVKVIYDYIKDKEPFTIEGYTATITYTEKVVEVQGQEGKIPEPVEVYLLNKDDMKNALYNTAAAFIGTDQLIDYEEGTQAEITSTGETITSVYFQEILTIRKDLVSTSEYIFQNEAELSQYLLFGTLNQQKSYITKVGENLEVIAERNNLSIEELLIANPQYSSANVLLSAGEKVNIGLIKPLINVVVRKTIVDDFVVNYQTVYQEDNTKYTDYSKTIQEGSNGIIRTTSDVLLRNGDVQNLIITGKEDIKLSVDKIVVKGTKKHSSAITGPPANVSGAKGWAWPTVYPFVITSKYGPRWGKYHRGIDISGTGFGSPIYNSADGVVTKVNNTCANNGYYGSKCGGGHGNHVTILTDTGYTVYYSHMKKNIKVKVGDRVSRGQKIGEMGNSGSSTGTHLHYQIQDPNMTYVNPCKGVFKC